MTTPAAIELADLHGKNALVTGSNTGIGRVTARELARAGARVWLACRSKERTQPVLDEIAAAGGRAEFVALDLADFASVRAAAAAFLATGEPLHILVNNAGVGGQRGLTKDGFELHFGVNHLGHYLFARLLQPALERAAPARVVNVSSAMHTRAKRIPWDKLRAMTGSRMTPEYAVSKLCNVLFTRELARRLESKGVSVFAVHPGGIASDIYRNVPWPVRPLILRFLKTVEEGAQSSLLCAAAPGYAGKTNVYVSKGTERLPSRVAQDPALAAELWRRSAEWTGLPS